MKPVKLELSYDSYLANKEWIDNLLSDVPLDGWPFGTLTLYLNVKLQD